MRRRAIYFFAVFLPEAFFVDFLALGAFFAPFFAPAFEVVLPLAIVKVVGWLVKLKSSARV